MHTPPETNPSTEAHDRRIILDPSTGTIYAASEAPHEWRRGGISPVMQSIVFETASGAWAGSVLVYASERLGDFTDEDLSGLLQEARARR